jgi:hypothetical protein
MAVIGFSRWRRSIALAFALCGASLASIPGGSARADDPPAASEDEKAEEEKLGELGSKLANPLADLWALSFSVNAPQFFDGNINTGDPEVGGSMLFQPVMPFPLYGEGQDQWRLITRPVIPFVFSTPIPNGFNEFDDKGGIGDIQLPLVLSPSDRITGHFIFGAGPIFLFPSATTRDLGQQQWAMGPAVVLGYKTEKATFGVFPNYFWKIGEEDQRQSTPDVSQMSLLYFFNYKLEDAWQVGFNPTISYNDKAPSGDKWNVPVGLYIGKMVRIGRLPVLLKAGGEYSVLSQDLFGLRFQFRFQITPVIPSLIQSPILGK